MERSPTFIRYAIPVYDRVRRLQRRMIEDLVKREQSASLAPVHKVIELALNFSQMEKAYNIDRKDAPSSGPAATSLNR